MTYGYLRDAPDPRDRLLSQLGLDEPPAEASVFDERVRIRDQGSTGSCVGQAIATAVRLAYLTGNRRECAELSALFAYYSARAEDGIEGDRGSRIRSAIKAVQRVGISSEGAWPFRVGAVNEMPPWRAFRDAHDARGVRGYYRVGSVGEVKRAIANRCPVVGGWDVDSEFQAYRGGVLGPCSAPYVGGHAMVIVSYSDNVFTLVNSWGADWGESGFVRVDAEFVERGRDKWAIDC